MKPNTPRQSPETPQKSRRADVRLEPPENLVCTIAGDETRIKVLNISRGGLGLLSDKQIAKGTRLELLLSMGPLTIMARGQTVHCQRQDDGRWVAGIAFVEDLSTGPNVESLIDAISNSTIRFS